ncbi:uncharacterized protein LOC143252862 isoform X3 [Tachypleus tridentatus]|uniref:uncharacterized protein LOC143252862 isoform X3 n=1 Tax=Tachypleus tridentatus TaxID=6853 RepID=UPI003FD0465D
MYFLLFLCHSGEHPRPEYLAKLSTVKKRKVKFITGVTVALVAMVGVIVYRISIQTVLYFTLNGNQTLISMVSLTTSVTAALLNLVCIMTFNLIYRRIATFLTELVLQFGFSTIFVATFPRTIVCYAELHHKNQARC